MLDRTQDNIDEIEIFHTSLHFSYDEITDLMKLVSYSSNLKHMRW